MGWEYIGYCKNYLVESGTTLNGDAVLDIQAGDLLVAICQWYSSDTSVSISYGGSNSLTMLNRITDAQYGVMATYGYKIAASANETATMTYTLGANKTYRGFIVLQFRPTEGTVYLDVVDYDANSGDIETANIQSDAISTTGDDELVIGGHASAGGENTCTISGAKIATLDIDGIPYSGLYYPHLWYKTFDSTQSNIYSSAVSNQDIFWFAAGILAFKNVSGLIVEQQQNLLNFSDGLNYFYTC
jgi:hypothetical protein